MAEERDEKELTGDLAVDDESAAEVTGGRESAGMTHETASELASEKTTSRKFTHQWTKHSKRHA
ncbi:MAG: hypothetical protein WCF24_05855 [Acidimicrobiales bacterium]